MPSDDLKQHAASKEDFYALLNIPATAPDSEIRRAYRRTALKYHPDKLSKPTAADLDRFHLLQIAYDVLSDQTVRTLYDAARDARMRRQREHEMLQGARRRMKEDLEARERGVKRSSAEAFAANVVASTAEDKLEREIQRLAEDGKRRRRAKEEAMRREVLEEEERREQERAAVEEAERDVEQPPEDLLDSGGGTAVPELDRTVKVRWLRTGMGTDIDRDRLAELFSRFGSVESAFTLRDKKKKHKKSKKTKGVEEGENEGREQMIATGIVVFSSVVGAHAAVIDCHSQRGPEWEIFQAVEWAAARPPDFVQRLSRPQGISPALNGGSSSSQSTSLTPSIPKSITTKTDSNYVNKQQFEFPGLNNSPASGSHSVPSFASFSAAGAEKSASSSTIPAGGSPNLEEITMIRLKDAERRRLEEQIQKEDEEADAADANGHTNGVR